MVHVEDRDPSEKMVFVGVPSRSLTNQDTSPPGVSGDPCVYATVNESMCTCVHVC